MAYKAPYDNPNLPSDIAYCADWWMRHCGGGERGRRRLLELCRFFVEPPKRAAILPLAPKGVARICPQVFQAAR